MTLLAGNSRLYPCQSKIIPSCLSVCLIVVTTVCVHVSMSVWMFELAWFATKVQISPAAAVYRRQLSIDPTGSVFND